MASPVPPVALATSPACKRNREPILQVLRPELAGCSRVLEVGSGTGEHAVYFSAALTHLLWLPSDCSAAMPGLAARVAAEGSANCAAPVVLDVSLRPWPVTAVNAIFSANTLHIMSWAEVRAFFAGLQDVLQPGGRLCIYGPFRYAGRPTAASNLRFDESLRARDPASGIRDFDAVDELARAAGLVLQADRSMPANNQFLSWRLPD